MKRNRENHHHFLQEPNSKKGTKPAVNFTFDDEENDMTSLTLGSLATRAPPPPQLHSLLLLVDEPEPQPQPQPQRQIHSAFDRFNSLPSSSSLVLNDVQSQLPAAATTTAAGSSNRRQPRGRRISRESPNLGKEDPTTVPVPYPWATTQHAMVHSKEYLLKNGITDIRGKRTRSACGTEPPSVGATPSTQPASSASRRSRRGPSLRRRRGRALTGSSCFLDSLWDLLTGVAQVLSQEYQESSDRG
ncbi:hypothetical protein PanWU01x14_142680 [Parasponia andersonii]|uniref:Uncharacterized protein n=1 Tax=Parasponia andersonii TaxID=3476 RepID=A0A2P5CLE2_PARAD|nr:hypothetical protein PanWU01x14_142680 [Parasponia andersonii]